MVTGDKAMVLTTVKERIKLLLQRMELVENEIEIVRIELSSLLAQVNGAQLARPKGENGA